MIAQAKSLWGVIIVIVERAFSAYQQNCTQFQTWQKQIMLLEKGDFIDF